MKKQAVALGQAYSSTEKSSALVVSRERLPEKDKIKALEEQVAYMQTVIDQLKAKSKKSHSAYVPAEGEQLNKDGIPIGLMCHGTTSKSPFLQFLEVLADGYIVGATKYESLSAAAEAVSGVRRSGWVFWRLNTGTTLKEAFKS